MSFALVIPALHFRRSSGSLDLAATCAYARRAAATWTDTFMLSGSTAGGHNLTPAERTQVLDVWLESTDAARLIACCWQSDDIPMVQERKVRPIVVLRGGTYVEALDVLAAMPSDAYVYSHPRYAAVRFDAELAGRAQASGVLPAGSKVSKVSLEELRAIRAAVGPEFLLWHGSSRSIAESIEMGASGIVATPLTSLPEPFPERAVLDVQRACDRIQVQLDQRALAVERSQLLLSIASRTL